MSLRAMRVGAVLSIRDLAKASGVSKTTIVDLVLGRQQAHPVTIRKLAAALNISPRRVQKELSHPS